MGQPAEPAEALIPITIQDSGHLGGDLACTCQEQRALYRGDRCAGHETLFLRRGSPWLNTARTRGPLFTSHMPSIACSTPNSRTPTRSWCPIRLTKSRPGRRA